MSSHIFLWQAQSPENRAKGVQSVLLPRGIFALTVSPVPLSLNPWALVVMVLCGASIGIIGYVGGYIGVVRYKGAYIGIRGYIWDSLMQLPKA